ncbi:hypothetical protein OPAG_03948 [Rhodococcus opacus PD630]|jgi:hypothetical protein|nr:hypothetical protein OPAG_03948 [Rhodococcus opacus PD630]
MVTSGWGLRIGVLEIGSRVESSRRVNSQYRRSAVYMCGPVSGRHRQSRCRGFERLPHISNIASHQQIPSIEPDRADWEQRCADAVEEERTKACTRVAALPGAWGALLA